MSDSCSSILEVLGKWLATRLDATSMAWVHERQAVVRSNDKKGLFLAFGMTPRKVGKADLALTPDELSLATTVRPDWNPSGWTIDQVVRTMLVLSLPEQESAALISTLDQLFGAGEVGELVALYQMLPLLPHPAAHILRAAEGVRTNIKAVFCAVAHRNPYPAEQFSDDQWNQMVLKCQFIGVSIGPIVGFDRRANPELASRVLDFAHERWAAKRSVAPDLWRGVGRYANQVGLNDLKHVLLTGSVIERQAAALALSECPHPSAEEILSEAIDLKTQLKAGQISWPAIESAGLSNSL